MKGFSKFLAGPYPWLVVTVVVFLTTIALGATAWAFAENALWDAVSSQETEIQATGNVWQGTTVQVVDPATIPDLFFEADLTPIHTISVPGQGTKVVRGWGWGYDYNVSFPDRPTLVQPFGARYENGTLTGRSWSGWGIPGEVQTWNVMATPPPEDPVEVKVLSGGQKIYGHNLLPGVIPLYNVEGDSVIRALIWVWRDEGTIRLRTWQVAVGYLVPADPDVYREGVPTPELTRPYDFSQFTGGKITDVHLTAVQTITTSEGWRVTQWKADRFKIQTTIFWIFPKTVVVDGGFYYWEPTPYETNPWYLKRLGDTWDPTRIVLRNLCPYQNAVPMTYLWEGTCP